MKKIFGVAGVLLFCVAAAFGDCGTLTNITEVVPLLHAGEPVHFNFEFDGGTAPYRFELVDGSLPAGLHLTPNGGLRGKPAAASDTVALIQVTDAAGCTLTVAYPIFVE